MPRCCCESVPRVVNEAIHRTHLKYLYVFNMLSTCHDNQEMRTSETEIWKHNTRITSFSYQSWVVGRRTRRSRTAVPHFSQKYEFWCGQFLLKSRAIFLLSFVTIPIFFFRLKTLFFKVFRESMPSGPATGSCAFGACRADPCPPPTPKEIFKPVRPCGSLSKLNINATKSMVLYLLPREELLRELSA